MKQGEFDPNDKEMLLRILEIRSKKEDKLRRKISQTKKQSAQLSDKKQQTIDERLEVIRYIKQLDLPTESLSQNKLTKFKIKLAKCYQDERKLAENVISIGQEIEEIEQTIKQMNREVLQLVKDQEKLKAVFDE
ncbi:hypothetical protein D5R81_03060 [Parashewanella spongiae]|uniref:Uncharacterized protein n=1 Tax=Parashewanella spongiae TaxID=342950 RepID=A0A3A6U0E9_9GAMM|nr:hypothetical protein [Parashewanella spongiae]MCL1076953.1 hypothetical protein [Parashewanella spongiae]RJY18931.1 hypothetical protein D5R81_03060 [Parashewanella spongiae]